MILIVGLGNVGSRYARTRHNAGFMVVDELARILNVTEWKQQSKLKAATATVEYQGQTILLAKPDTMMNASGEAVQRLAQHYKIHPSNIWLICDDVDTPFGRMRIRFGGSSGGQQGIRSTMQLIGEDFWRARFGISLNDRAVEPSEVYVLKPFNPSEAELLGGVVTRAAETITKSIFEPPHDGTTVHLI